MGLLDDYKQLLTNERQKSKLNGLLGPLSQQVTSNLESNFPFLFKDPRQLKPEDAAGLLGGGIAGTFIGPKSAIWNKEIADKAAGLLDAGVDPAKVWKEHLIGRMPDGALFSEIDDSLSAFNANGLDYEQIHKNINKQINGGNRLVLNNVLSHKALTDNYPDLSKIKVWLDEYGFDGVNGSHSPSANSIDIAYDLSPNQAKSVMLHEIQHAIQTREPSFAVGGNPSQMEKQGFENGFNAYRQLTGEAQARATQDRMNMSMDERRANYPLQGGLLSDIPLDQLIYRYGDNGPAASIDVSHGSPHTFDKFDMSKIGTGEGAQAYGHGLYFAENPEVAKEYQKLQPITDQTDGGFIMARSAWADSNANMKKAMAFLDKHEKLTNDAKDFLTDKGASQFADISRAREILSSGQFGKGNLYNVSLEWPDAAREAADPLGPQHFLDWDKPLSEQPDSVKNAWGNLFGGLPAPQGPLGRTLKGLMAEDDLKAEGIPGIRYLDGGSRGAGNGSYNYVVFDDQIPRIVERNGKPLKGLLSK